MKKLKIFKKTKTIAIIILVLGGLLTMYLSPSVRHCVFIALIAGFVSIVFSIIKYYFDDKKRQREETEGQNPEPKGFNKIFFKRAYKIYFWWFFAAILLFGLLTEGW